MTGKKKKKGYSKAYMLNSGGEVKKGGEPPTNIQKKSPGFSPTVT